MDAIKKLSDIQITENHRGTLQFLTNSLKHRKPEFPAPGYFMLLGAGCSIDAKIPSGGGITKFLQKRHYAKHHLSYDKAEELEIDKIDKLFESVEVQEKLQAFVTEKQKACHARVDEQKEALLKTIPSELTEILTKENPSVDLWEIVKEEFYQTSYYSFWFDITLPSPRERQQLIEKIIDGKEPSAAYFLLACAVQKDIFRTFFTTNFDDLINDAILQETGKKSRVYVHNEVAKFINFRSPKPNIIKLHGDYLYQDMKNTLAETSTLQDDQLSKLQEASQDMAAIIVGYSGSDLSIMNALYKIKEEKGADFPIFWCAKNEDSITWRAKHLINQFENSHFVPTESFDQLMFSIYSDLDCKIRDIKEKTDVVENNHKKAIDLLNRLNKDIEVPDYLEDKKEKLEDDLSISEIKIAYLDLGIEKYFENANLYLWRGYYFRQLEKNEEAIKDYDKAIELEPNITAGYNNRGLAKNYLKKYEEAIKDLNKAIELDPNYLFAYNNRGLAKYNLKQYEEAIKDYNRAIAIDSNYSIAYYNRGSVKDDLKQYEEAIKDYDKVIELDPNFSIAYNSRGRVKNNLKKYVEAIQDLDKAIELDPNYSKAYSHKGKALIEMNKLVEVEKCVKKSIELDNEYSYAYAVMAVFFAKKEEIDFFYKNFEIALQKDIDLEKYNLLEDVIIKPFLKKERFLDLLKKYGKVLK
jgi:tetratricopeptide (TPR) repeat protein